MPSDESDITLSWSDMERVGWDTVKRNYVAAKKKTAPGEGSPAPSVSITGDTDRYNGGGK